MARFGEPGTTGIYQTAARWRDESLINGESLLWSGEKVWTLDNLKAFKACFIDKPDTSKDSFEVKFKKQLDSESPLVTKLACELLLVHLLFTASVSGARKRKLISTVAGWKGIEVDDGVPAMACLDHHIGGTGLAFNTRRPFELMYLALVALRLVQLDPAQRAAVLGDHRKMRELLDDEEGDNTYATFSCRASNFR
jgi:5-methylcytosine-specific restriction protein B